MRGLFSTTLARDPKREEEFWAIIEETFEQVEGALTDYPVETRDEALEPQRSAPLESIRYRGASEHYDSRDYFIELGRRFLPEVERQIGARELTPKFAKDWGVIMMCYGFIASHILDDSDGLFRARVTRRSANARNREPQKKWIAHQLLRHFKAGCKRKQAEGRVEKLIQDILERGEFPTGFDRSWFESMLKDGALVHTYHQKHMPDQDLQEFADQPTDDIPPVDFSP